MPTSEMNERLIDMHLFLFLNTTIDSMANYIHQSISDMCCLAGIYFGYHHDKYFNHQCPMSTLISSHQISSFNVEKQRTILVKKPNNPYNFKEEFFMRNSYYFSLALLVCTMYVLDCTFVL